MPEASGAEQHTPYFTSLLLRDRRRLPSGASSLPGEHLGLGVVAAALRADEHQVRIVDACVLLHASLVETLDAILAEPLDVLGFTSTADIHAEVAWLADAVRAAGFDGLVMMGNDHASLNDTAILGSEPSIDVIVRSDAELVTVALLRSLAANGNVSDTPGVSWRSNTGRIIRNPSPTAGPLDALPHPDRDTALAVRDLGLSLGVSTKRGCPFDCAFCTKGAHIPDVTPTRTDVWRHRSARASADHFIEIAETFSVDHITILDDLFVGRDPRSRNWAQEFADTLAEGDSKVSFMFDVRADGVEGTLFERLRTAGLRRVFIGLESGAESSLRGLNKRLRPEAAIDAMATLRALDIEVYLGFMCFDTFITREGLRQNLDFLMALQVPDYQLHLQSTRVYPGTPLAWIVDRQGLLDGAFPHPVSRFSDPDITALYPWVKWLGRHVELRLSQYDHRSTCSEMDLFLQFNEALRRATELRDLNSNTARRWVETEASAFDALFARQHSRVDHVSLGGEKGGTKR